ncbi:MAG TPA: Type 1 glutamine amidotransferase-like domain-containing protein [Ktedonobacteraceae bacterium]|nr:Type 1 glutamine amidotransferase-like domain-containing protein [Ktedonobacteraceae bacterium]
MTAEKTIRPMPGAIALVGSGEYLDAMNTTDTYLIETLGGKKHARVALLPTASGLEEGGPSYWNNLGLSHFQALGVKDVRATAIVNRDSASDPEQLELLRDANFFYFSGGNPQHIIGTLRDSPAWEIISSAYEQGAVLAGCSAGAMALSGYTISIRQVMAGEKLKWVDALGVVPQVVVFPHFDRMSNFIDQQLFQELLATLPKEHIVLGIDEDTALVRTNFASEASQWQVMGRQTVKMFVYGQDTRTLHIGETIMLHNNVSA